MTFDFSTLPEILQSPILDLTDLKSTLNLLRVNSEIRRYHLTHGVSKKRVVWIHYDFRDCRVEDEHLLVKTPLICIGFKNRQSLMYDWFPRSKPMPKGKEWIVDLKQEKFLKLLLRFKTTRGLLITVLPRLAARADASEFKSLNVMISRLAHACYFRSCCSTYSVLASLYRFLNTKITSYWDKSVHESDQVDPDDKDFLNRWIQINLANCKKLSLASEDIREFRKGLSNIHSNWLRTYFSWDSMEAGIKSGVISANPDATMHFEYRIAGEGDCAELMRRLLNNPHLQEITGDRAEIIWYEWKKVFTKIEDDFDKRFFKRKFIENGRVLVCMSQIQNGGKRIGFAMRSFKETLV